jgi:chromosome segregation ATPase
MRRAFFCTIVFLGMAAYALGQAASSDSQTLQSLLNEVRGLRQDLRISQNRTQSMQILLARLQMQEGAITRASDRLYDARQKRLDTQVNQKELGLALKRLEDELSTAEDPQLQTSIRDRIKHTQSDLEVVADVVQERQTTEAQAERQLRDEQDKLSAIETQLDELIRSMATVKAQ